MAAIVPSKSAGRAAGAAAVAGAAAGAVAGAAAGSAAGPAVEAEQQKICQAAADVLKRFGKGKQRIPLEQMGISPLNRVISGKHVHMLGRRILSVESFATFRYRFGLCHDWDPQDPLAVANFTNRAARRDALLAPVPEVPLYGSFAKSHLLSFLQALKSKAVRWSDSGDLMVPDEAQEVLMDHLKHGMYYEVLDYRAIREHRDAVLGLCAADNFDAGFALGQTEIELLRTIACTLEVARPPPGSSQFDVVRSTVERSAGQRWSNEDLAAMYNLAKVIGKPQMEFLLDFVVGFVEQDIMAVKPSCFGQAAKIAPQAPWLKTALLCTQYMSQESCQEKGVGNKMFGVQISKKHWAKFQACSGAELLSIESFLAKVFGNYRNLSGTSEQALGRELPGFFVRVGKRCLLAENMADVEQDFAKLEMKLREQFPMADLPPPVVADLETPVAKKRKVAAFEIVPDEGPALAFAGDSVISNMHCEARALGFAMGCGVSCSRSVHGVKKGTQGVIVGFLDNAIEVLWQNHELFGNIPMKLKDIALADGKAAAKAVGEKNGKASKGADGEKNGKASAGADGKEASAGVDGSDEASAGAEGIAWREGKSADGDVAILWLVGSALHDLCRLYGPTHDMVRITTIDKSPQVFAACDIPAGKLMILPNPHRLTSVCPLSVDNVVRVSGSLMNKDLTFYLLDPTSGESCPKLMGDGGEVESEAGPVRMLSMYWFAMGLAGKPGKGGVSLVHATMSVDVPLATAIVRSPVVKSKRPAKALNLQVPFITNDCDIKAGSRLVAKKKLITS